MDTKEIVEEVLEILRNTDGDTALQVICDLDTDYILSNMKKESVENRFAVYCDGHGQAIENIRQNLKELFKHQVAWADVEQVIDACAEIKEEEL